MPSCTLDPGHWRGEAGKGSPDGVFKEWAFTHDVAMIATETLNAKGITCTNIHPEGEEYLSLPDRCKKIKEITKVRPDNINVSIHVNAAGMGDKWYDARGCQVNTKISPDAKTIRLANIMYDEMVAQEFKVRPESPTMHYRPKRLTMCSSAGCPSVLIEFFFMDNKQDLEYLCSATSIYECAEIISNGVLKYFGKL